MKPLKQVFLIYISCINHWSSVEAKISMYIVQYCNVKVQIDGSRAHLGVEHRIE